MEILLKTNCYLYWHSIKLILCPKIYIYLFFLNSKIDCGKTFAFIFVVEQHTQSPYTDSFDVARVDLQLWSYSWSSKYLAQCLRAQNGRQF